MHLQSGQGRFDQCRYTVMVSHTGELQAVVFGAAFKSEDHALSEEGKHVNVQPNPRVEYSHLSLVSPLLPPNEVVFIVCSKHLNTAWSLVHALNTCCITRFLFEDKCTSFPVQI